MNIPFSHIHASALAVLSLSTAILAAAREQNRRVAYHSVMRAGVLAGCELSDAENARTIDRECHPSTPMDANPEVTLSHHLRPFGKRQRMGKTNSAAERRLRILDPMHRFLKT